MRKRVIWMFAWMVLAAASSMGAISVWAQPGAVIAFCSCVYDDVGIPIANQPVSWSVSAGAYSGYHNHNSPIRSPGFIDPPSGATTGLDGCARGVYYATDVAGVYWLESWACTSFGPTSDYMEIQVRVSPELIELPNYFVYQKAGSTSAHPLSHYGAFGAVYTLQQICEEFYSRTGLIAGINDMSLPWGGRFDLGPGYGGLWWGPPHHEHMQGRNADVPYSYLGSSGALFVQIAQSKGAQVVGESNHYHLRLPD